LEKERGRLSGIHLIFFRLLMAMWIFSELITYIASHLINTNSLNKIYICKHCLAENGIYSRDCSACDKKLISLPLE